MEQEKEPEPDSNRRWATDGPHGAQPAPWGALKLHWPLRVVTTWRQGLRLYAPKAMSHK